MQNHWFKKSTLLGGAVLVVLIIIAGIYYFKPFTQTRALEVKNSTVNLGDYTIHAPSEKMSNPNAYPGNIYLIIGNNEAVKLIGPNLSKGDGVNLASLFRLDNETITLLEQNKENQQTYQVVVNPRLTYEITMDNYDGQAILAGAVLTKTKEEISSEFTFAVPSNSTSGVVHLQEFAVLVDGKKIKTGGTFSIEAGIEIPASDPNYKRFQNPVYGYSLEYPKGWRIEQYGSNDDSPAANYQMNVWSPIGEQIVIQIWDNNQEKLSLMEWYEARETTHLIVENAPTGPNARIAGEDAIMVARPKVVGVPAEVITLLSHEGKIFLLRYSATTESVESLPKYLHLLQTFEFNNKNTEDVLVPIKESELM